MRFSSRPHNFRSLPWRKKDESGRQPRHYKIASSVPGRVPASRRSGPAEVAKFTYRVDLSSLITGLTGPPWAESRVLAMMKVTS
jgi:hypothetical protein